MLYHKVNGINYKNHKNKSLHLLKIIKVLWKKDHYHKPEEHHHHQICSLLFKFFMIQSSKLHIKVLAGQQCFLM